MHILGENSLDINCPENTALYDFIQSIYKYNLAGSITDRLVAIFSYHSTGGEIYGYPDSKYANSKQCLLHLDAMKHYSKNTNYSLVDDEQKYGVMDFYRIVLNNVVTLTIKLSKINGNPIGPFADLENNFFPTIIENKKALFSTLDLIVKNLK